MRGTAVQARGSAAHWKVTEDPKVQRTVRNAAKSIANMNQGIVDADDMFSEGLLLVATVPRIAEHAICGEFGLVYTEVRERLFKAFIRPLDRSGELDARKYHSTTVEDGEADSVPFLAFDDGTGDYTEDAVRLLLPAVWDESYAYGLPDRDDAPSKDMPKGASNKARSNNHWAYIADIKTGWAKTPLTLTERQAVLLYFGMAWTQSEIARYLGSSQQAVSNRIDAAVRKITARLNGAHHIED